MFALPAFLALFATLAFAAPAESPLKELKLKRGDGTVHDLLERAGPSGVVIQPPGGEAYTNWNQNGYATEWIYINYQTVQESGTNTNTIGIDLYLETLDGSPLGFDGTITNGFMAPDPNTDNIIGWFLFPRYACGTFRLVFTEHQIYERYNVINFRAAAPTISITCQPYTG